MNKEVLNAKAKVVSEVEEKIKNSGAIVIVQYHGLSVKQLTELRRELRKVGATLSIHKNSLTERACENLGHTEFKAYLSGPTAMVASSDPLAGLKVATKYARKNDNLKVVAGLVEGQIVTEETIKSLSKIPSKEGLLSMLLSVLQAPIRNLACAVKAVADAK